MQKNIVTHHAEGVPHAVKLQIPKNTKNTEKLYKLLKNNETLNLNIAHHAEDMPHLAVKDLGGWPHRFHAHWTLELPAHRGEALPHLVKVGKIAFYFLVRKVRAERLVRLYTE